MARRDDTPRDLLFGLLALQIGLIDQDQLVAAFGVWSRNRGRPLAEVLLERGAIDAESGSLLAAMAEKQLKLHGGDAEKSLAAVAAGPSTREKLAALGDTDLTSSVGLVGPQAPSPDATATMTVGTATSEGQRFRVLRPHAQGGLGAVFVALDGELNREVALKQILDHHADDPTSRTRFLIEAEITGGLEHPGIVPVYGLGTYGDGRPYYAMRFIRGDSLKEAIAAFHADESLRRDPGRRSLALRKLLRRFVDVCNAIDYAHGRGVLHRDLKPGNVIVGRHGETLVVDWGLAKPMGHAEAASTSDERTLMPSSSSGSAETLPGSAIGTPAYMSPEQARGDLERLGPRSDVYSLGATLYCLLTGRAPFEGADLGAVLRDVQRGAFPPPRQVDPAIDKALEAVCLKAMALRTEDRHASARALADDVERWAADEPVTAWREPMARRVRRWARRNRTTVSVAAASALVAVVGLAAVLAVQTRANAALTDAYRRLEASNDREVKANANLKAANDRVRARFALAQEAIRTYHTGVSEDLLLKQKEFGALRTRLLRGAREFYRKLEGLLEGQEDRESRVALGRAYHDVGQLTQAIGSFEEALAVYRRGLGLFEALALESPGDAEARFELARASDSIGILLGITGHPAEALAGLDRGRSILRSLVEPGPADDAVKVELAHAEHAYGTYTADAGRAGEELESYERARAILEALVAANPTDERSRLELASTCSNLGYLLSQVGRSSESGSAFGRARELCEALVEANPADPRFAHELARALGNWSTTIPSGARVPETDAALDRAMKVLEATADASPSNLALQADIAWIGALIAYQLLDAGRDAEALAAFERALSARERLARANPSSTRQIEQQVQIHRKIAEIHGRAGRPAEARASYQKSVAIGERGAEAFPSAPDLFEELAYVYPRWIACLVANGETAEALAASERMRAAVARLLEIHSSSLAQAQRADFLRRLGTALQSTGQAAEAVAQYRRSLALLEGLEKPTPVNIYDMACCHSLIAGAATVAGSGLGHDEGRLEADRAVAGLRRAFEAGYTKLQWARTGDTDLEMIRSRPDFQHLMMDLAFPDRPFAR